MTAAPLADLIVTNAKVVTLDGTDRIARAIAIRGDRFIAVGRDDDIAALAGSSTRRIDARGRLVVPGLIDGHAHMDREGLKDRLPSLAGCRSIGDITDRVAALARRSPPGEWIVTMPVGDPPFYEGVPDILKEGRFPTRHDLDRAAPDNPVYIRAIWGHWRSTLPLVSIANTAALKRAGVTDATEPPSPTIKIEKEQSSGQPTGVFYEYDMKPLVEFTLFSMIPRFTHVDRVEGLAQSMRVYSAFGTTSVFEGHGIAGEVLAAYQALRAEGPLAVRAVLMFSPAWPSTDMASIHEMLVDWGRWLAGRGLGDEYLRMCGLFTEAEYTHDNLLRAQCGPYTGWAGFNYDCALPEATMIEMMIEAARNGIRVGMIGPRALTRFEQVDRKAPIAGQRWVLEHAGYFGPEEIARIGDLGCVVQSYSEKWIERDGDEILAKQGTEAGERALPMRSLIGAGVHVALATDNVPPTLFEAIAHVVRRRTSGGQVLGPGQALTRLEALAAASREGAYLSFDEAEKGTIEAGKLADLAILSDDLLTVEDERIAGISSVLTITGGRIVHDDETLTAT